MSSALLTHGSRRWVSTLGLALPKRFKSAAAACEYGLVDEVLERRPEESIQAS